MDRTVEGGYVSDLLSDVIAGAKEGDLWLTLQVHQNIVAVAFLNNLVGIIVVGGKEPDADTIKKAHEQGVPLMVSSLNTYELAEMTPRAIVRAALAAGLDMIAVCDHNSARNTASTGRTAEGSPLVVIPGIEVTSTEEVHIVGLFPNDSAAERVQEEIYWPFRGKQRADFRISGCRR